MKKYVNPSLEIEELKIMDVITTSYDECDLKADDCSNDAGAN